MKHRLMTIVYIVIVFIGLLRIPSLLRLKQMRRAKNIGGLIPEAQYLAIRHIFTNQLYIIIDTYAERSSKVDEFYRVIKIEASKIYIQASSVRLGLVHADAIEMYDPDAHFVKLVDVPAIIMPHKHRLWLATALRFMEIAKVAGYHYPSKEDIDTMRQRANR